MIVLRRETCRTYFHKWRYGFLTFRPSENTMRHFTQIQVCMVCIIVPIHPPWSRFPILLPIANFL